MFLPILYIYLIFSYVYIGRMIIMEGNWKDDFIFWLVSPAVLIAILFTKDKPKF